MLVRFYKILLPYTSVYQQNKPKICSVFYLSIYYQPNICRPKWLSSGITTKYFGLVNLQQFRRSL